MNAKPINLKRLIRLSHERQFKGDDYQGVAIDLCTEAGIEYGTDEHKAIESSPEPGCDCGFCATAPWRDE